MIWLNGVPLIFKNFPNNEHLLEKDQLDCGQHCTVKLAYEDDADFMRLAMVKTHLDSLGCVTSLYLTYMPHSRMDRPNPYYATSLEAAARLINAMGFLEVTVREPHSRRTLELLENSAADEWCLARLPRVLETGAYDSIFFPDYGAGVRYRAAGYAGVSRLSFGVKVRDFATGQITGLSFSGEVGSSVLIVDDLCSKGGTFVEGAKLLRAQGAKRVGLLVAYVEDNVSNGELFGHIDMVFTAAERNLSHPRITILD